MVAMGMSVLGPATLTSINAYAEPGERHERGARGERGERPDRGGEGEARADRGGGRGPGRGGSPGGAPAGTPATSPGGRGHPDRGTRPDRGERPDRGGDRWGGRPDRGGDRGGHPDRGTVTPPPPAPDRGRRPDRGERPDRGGDRWGGRPDRGGDRGGRPDRGTVTPPPPAPDRGGRPDRGGERPGRGTVTPPPRPPERPPVVRPPVRVGRGWDRGLMDRRRDDIRVHRDARRSDIWRVRERARSDRSDWRGRFTMNTRCDVGWVRSPNTWVTRFSRWETRCDRPALPIYSRPVRWAEPMPEVIVDYQSVELIAQNIEQLSRDVYQTMDSVINTNPNREYAARLMRVLGELADASENFTDAVYDSDDFSDSLNDLFFLETKVGLATQTLSGYSKEYLVTDEMRALRYYVEELLWQYRQKY